MNYIEYTYIHILIFLYIYMYNTYGVYDKPNKDRIYGRYKAEYSVIRELQNAGIEYESIAIY